ncbi:MAG: DUF503 domain-containing protein [Phycisphaerales bacterium]|nr:MAG: DUF503 domain-containing protein [Phycisphaerales bacterium]
MIVGVLRVDLAVFDARTLKDKRRVIQSVKQRLRNAFNVSVAEVDFGDSPKRCRLAIAMVSKESRPLHSQLDQMVELIRNVGGLTLLDYERELL